MLTTIQEKVKFCAYLADQLLEVDGWGADTVEDKDGTESYTSYTQDRFNDYYGLISAALETAQLTETNQEGANNR